nr:DNA internalization-related competence protein ComEC/Rec2 [Marinobacter santoriniensis]
MSEHVRGTGPNFPRPGFFVGGPGAFAFACGDILLYRLSILPASWMLLIIFMTAFCSVRIVSSRWLHRFLWLVVCLVGGLAWGCWHSSERLSQRLPARLEGVPVVVSGYVCDLPSRGSFRSLRFSFCVTGWPGRAHPNLPDKLRLTWYHGDPSVLEAHRLTLTVTLKRPHGTLNPAGFRYEDWLFRQGFRATGTVQSASPASSLVCGWHCRYTRWHQALARWVESQFGGARHYPLIASLMIGNRGSVTDSQWEVLKATGTVHLVAISGLHLGLIAFAVGIAVRQLLLSVPASRLSASGARRCVLLVVGLCCLVYALAAGFTVPTRRALVMAVLAMMAAMSGSYGSPWRTLVIALVLVLLLDPFAPLDQGFWLSFSAVAILVLIFSNRLGRPGWLRGLLLAQAGVFVGLAPVLAQFGQSQPVAGLLANVFAIPWVSFVVMPVIVLGGLVVAALPDLSSMALPLMDGVLDALWWVLVWLSKQSWPATSAATGTLVFVAVLGLVAIRLPLPWSRPATILAVTLWLLAGADTRSAGAGAIPTSTRIQVFDVGQGLSVLLTRGNRALLYDTGPAVPGVFSAVESTIVPNLKALGIERIDTLVVSHNDRDHAGGLKALFSRLPVNHLVTGEPTPIARRLAGMDVPVVDDCASRQFRFSGLELSFWRDPLARSGNDASCVLTIRDREADIEWILPGDITTGTEARFLDARSGKRASDPSVRIVLAPHHGSRSSSSARWVRALAPDYVIYSAGYHHHFGHPHPSVVRRYREVGAVALNTACSGAITMTGGPRGLIIGEAVDESPFWIGGAGLARDQCKIP